MPCPSLPFNGRHPHTSDDSSRQRLRSANHRQLMVPRLVVGLSPLRVQWNGTRFQIISGTLLRVLTASNRLIFLRHKGASSALEALRDALYKSTTNATVTTTTLTFNPAVRLPVAQSGFAKHRGGQCKLLAL